jgi:hypothetical protein
MRAYVARVDHAGLQRFLPEDAVPRDLIRQLVREWSSAATTVVWAVVAEGDAEAIRRELGAGRHDTACNLLLNRAVEVLPFGTVEPELTPPVGPHQ